MRQPTAPFSVTAGIGASLHFAATVNLILHVTKIAIFCQDDSFGRDGLAGVRARERVVVSKAVPFPWHTRSRSSPTARPPKRPSIPPCRRASSRWRDICRAASLETGGAAPDPCRTVAGRPRGRPVRYQRKHHHRRTKDAGYATQGLPHRHSEGRILQGRRPAVMERRGTGTRRIHLLDLVE